MGLRQWWELARYGETSEHYAEREQKRRDHENFAVVITAAEVERVRRFARAAERGHSYDAMGIVGLSKELQERIGAASADGATSCPIIRREVSCLEQNATGFLAHHGYPYKIVDLVDDLHQRIGRAQVIKTREEGGITVWAEPMNEQPESLPQGDRKMIPGTFDD